MKNNAAIVMLCLLFYISCTENQEIVNLNQEEEIIGVLLEKTQGNKNFRVLSDFNCNEMCVYKDSEQYFEISEEQSILVGNTIKSVKYSAYNTFENFVLEVVTDVENSDIKARTNFKVRINQEEYVYNGLNINQIVKIEIPLNDYMGCETFNFEVEQFGYGQKITLANSYNLIPVCENNEPAIGEIFQGGVVVYICQPGDECYVEGEFHGIAAANEAIAPRPWGCVGIDFIVDNADGRINTETILKNCSDINSAAVYCDELVYNGFRDWYLPSIEEIQIFKVSRLFRRSTLLSSTSLESFTAIYYSMDILQPSIRDRNQETSVLPIRKF